MKKKRKEVGRPPAWLWYPVLFFLRVYYRLRYGVRFFRDFSDGIRGPALIVAPHTAIQDPFFIGMAVFPRRPNYVVSAHLLARRKTRGVLRLCHVIPKTMFSADPRTVLGIRRALSAGNTVVLFPEGRLPCFGRSVPLAAGTAELIRRMGVDVYTVTNNGAYLTFPKWAKKARRGRIDVRTSRLFRAEELAALSPRETERRLNAALFHDDEAAMQGVVYKCRDMTAGVDGILYRCPGCLRELTLSARGGHIRCDCGLDATLSNEYRLHGVRFPTLGAWYRWQEEVLDTSIPLTSRVRVGTPDDRGIMREGVGEGVATLDSSLFSFEGTVNGEPLAFCLPVEKIGGLPITVSRFFDIYYRNRLYYLSPLPDPRIAVKWVSFLDKVHAEANRSALLSAADAAGTAPL